MYQRINGDDYRQIFIVGDLHGCFDLLEMELANANFDRDQDLSDSAENLAVQGEDE